MLQIIKFIASVRSEVQKGHPVGALPYRLEDIRRAIVASTGVDSIEIYGYRVEDNPIKGMFKKYFVHANVYGEPKTHVEIRYSLELNPCWRRFVICKELCHSFVADRSALISSKEQVAKLAELLILAPESREVLAAFSPFVSEKLAEFAALELLCPIEDRQKIVKARSAHKLSDMQLATAFRIPVDYAKRLFDPQFVNFVSSLYVDEHSEAETAYKVGGLPSAYTADGISLSEAPREPLESGKADAEVSSLLGQETRIPSPNQRRAFRREIERANLHSSKEPWKDVDDWVNREDD